MKFIIYTLILFSFNTLAQDALKPYFENNKTVIIVGVIPYGTLPNRLQINARNMNQEEMFIGGLSLGEKERYTDTKVVVQGKLKIYQKQYMLIKEKIRPAGPSEYDKVLLDKF